MQKQHLILGLVASLLFTAMAAQAGNILLIRMGGPDYPNDLSKYPDGNTARNGVFTEQEDITFSQVDDTFVTALIAAGHRVTAFWLNDANISDADLDRINTFDACIISYSVNSGPFNMGNANNTNAPVGSTYVGRKWDTMITAPIILTKANLARVGGNRLGWFSQMSSNEWFTAPSNYAPTPNDYDSANDLSTTASGKLTIVDVDNPIFAGITFTNSGSDRVMSNYFTIHIDEPALNRGNSPATLKVVIDGVDQGYTNDLSPGGRILATLEFNPFDPGISLPAGEPLTIYENWVVTGVAIAEWPIGSRTYRYCQDDSGTSDGFCDTLVGYRMFFGAGTRDPAGTVKDPDGFKAGGYDLTPDGTKIFMASVDRAILQGSTPTLTVEGGGANVTVRWHAGIRTWKLQRSTDLATWTPVTSGIDNNSFTVPVVEAKTQFFRLSPL